MISLRLRRYAQRLRCRAGIALPLLLLSGACSCHFPAFNVDSRSERNFAVGTETPRTFGTYEVVIRGRGAVANPFETRATITFTPPSGQAHAITVEAFYDGGSTWRGRVYVTESGGWRWNSRSPDDPLLDGHSGSFTASIPPLHGILRKDNRNPKQWMTDDGRWFLNVGDTAYDLFAPNRPYWKQYVADDVAHGITSLRVDLIDNGWNGYWINPQRTQFNLALFQMIDARLRWILDRYPELQFQLKLFPGPPWGKDDVFWRRLPPKVRRKTMQYLIARLAAYPNIFFEVTNDTFCTPNFPRNRAMAREVGEYFKNHDPWNHLISFGPNRGQRFCFLSAEDDWVTYIAIEGAFSLSGDEVALYAEWPLHVFLEEDYYEQARPPLNPQHPRYFYRRLFWSWLLSGGSANYGGRWAALDPYSQTSTLPYQEPRSDYLFRTRLLGLDSIPPLVRYFSDRGIELWRFQPDDKVAIGHDGQTGCQRIKAARRATEEYLLYAPNATSCGAAAARNSTRAVRLRIDLSATNRRFRVEWFRAVDGLTKEGQQVEGGRHVELTSPWAGEDVVLYMQRVSQR